jgi:radical SAM superfamily enzyme YgiQ (UPF0313 family)
MKILFVKPPRNKISISGDSNLEPLEFELLAAPLKGHHDVSILDMRLENKLDATLERFRPDVVGLTGYTIDVYSVLNIAEKIKKYNPCIKVIVGGHHATILPQDFYNQAVDFVVIGDGEVTFHELITNLEKRDKLEAIPGIAINNKEGQKLTPRRPIPKDLKNLPVPDRSLTKRYRSQYFSSIYRPIATMVTSRGCPFRCKFCSVWKSMDGKYLARDVKSVTDELELIEEPYVSFIDDNLTSNFRHFETLYNEIEQRGIQKMYRVLGRTDAIVKRPDLIEKWSKLGLRQIILGLEAIKDADLKILNKHNTAENNLKAIHILNDNGVGIKPYFIVTQDFEKQDFEELYKFVEKTGIENPSFSILTPLPGTTLYDEVKDKICLKNYEFYDLAHSVLPTKLPREEFYDNFLKLYTRFYSPKKFITSAFKKTVSHVIGKPVKISSYIPFRRSLFYSIIFPIVCKKHYKEELRFKFNE